MVVSSSSRAGSLPAARFPFRRKPLLLWGAVTGIALLIGYQFYAWWVSPEHRINQFIAAFQQDDPAAMLSLADLPELNRLGLTPDKFRALVADAAGVPGGARFGAIEEEQYNDKQRRYNRTFRVHLLDRAGKPLANAKGVYVTAYNTDRGWKVAVSEFLRTLCAVRREQTGLTYGALCQRHGIPAEYLSPVTATWKSAPAASP